MTSYHIEIALVCLLSIVILTGVVFHMTKTHESNAGFLADNSSAVSGIENNCPRQQAILLTSQ